MKKLERTTFETSRELEFFSEKELQMQIGQGKPWWPVAVLKELIDNSLDACETADVAPVVEVTIESGGFTVSDNGPGLPPKTLTRSLEYMKRVSDKTFYVSPTRGQLGNALKVVWAAPFVSTGESLVEVLSQGYHHIVNVSVDRIAQRPVIQHGKEKVKPVKNGTETRVHWSDSACLLETPKTDDFYKSPPMTAPELLENYAAFNPHATFQLGEVTFEATDLDWKKWKPDAPTSAHWYTAETLRDLIAAYITDERNENKSRTVREFVSEFRGLSATAKQKEVTTGLSRVYLRDLVDHGDIDMATLEQLLKAMQNASTPPKPTMLGVIGEGHFKAWMTRYANVCEDSVRYVKRVGKGTVPHVIEVAFGVREKDEAGRRILTGLNWSPTLGIPVSELQNLIGEMRVDHHDPVTIAVHMARPRFEFVDKGKTRLQL